MKEYNIIAIGTGSAMNVISPLMDQIPDIKVAVVESGPVGGICLTRGCIPSKLILYPAEVIEIIRQAEKFGIKASIEDINFPKIMSSMRNHIGKDSAMIKRGLEGSPNIDFYHTKGEFIGDHTMKVGEETIKADIILICSGSRPHIPPIPGLKEAGYLTSTSFLKLTSRPKSMIVIGGGYIAAEYGHFMASMGSEVTILGRNERFVPHEEPEVSELLKQKLEERMRILTGIDIRKVEINGDMKRIHAINRGTGEEISVEAEEILVAAGRASYSNILKPELTGVKTDKRGWILVNEKMETSKSNIYAFGDAIGMHQFKHVANMESSVVLYNAFAGMDVKMSYHAVPAAIFTYPEVASVGMGEQEAKEGGRRILVGRYNYEDTAKGSAMGAKDYFVKVIVEQESNHILGAHIIGPHASILIQEIINLMYTKTGSYEPITDGMHIHPALNEVVERAFYNLQDPDAHLHAHEHHQHDHEHDHGNGHDHGNSHNHGNGPDHNHQHNEGHSHDHQHGEGHDKNH